MTNPNHSSFDPNKEIAQALAIEESRFRIACTSELRRHNAESITRNEVDEQSNQIEFYLTGEPLYGSRFYMAWERIDSQTGESTCIIIEQTHNHNLSTRTQPPPHEQPGELRVLRYENILPDDVEELAESNDPAVYEGRARLEDLQFANNIIRTSAAMSQEHITPDSYGTLPHEVQVAKFLGELITYENNRINGRRRFAVRRKKDSQEDQ